MGNRYASGKNAIAECDRCGFRFKLKVLRKEIIKTKTYNLLVCPQCWDPDQPQLQLGMYPVDDPQAVREPRPDRSYYQSGLNGLQILNGSSPDTDESGYPEGGSRVFQWGWNPVGGARFFDTALTPNYLVLLAEVGTVTIQIGA
jgi:hypothetical protein